MQKNCQKMKMSAKNQPIIDLTMNVTVSKDIAKMKTFSIVYSVTKFPKDLSCKKETWQCFKESYWCTSIDQVPNFLGI